MSKWAYFLVKNKKRFAFTTASATLGVTSVGLCTLLATKSDSTPVTGRNRILLHKPSWDLQNGELQKRGLEEEWVCFRSEPYLKKKLDLLSQFGVKKLIEDKNISPESIELLKSMSWDVESAVSKFGFFGIAFATSRGYILCDRFWVERGLGFNGVLAHEMSHSICRHSNELDVWKNLIVSLPVLITFSASLFAYAKPVNPILAIPATIAIFFVTHFALFGLAFRAKRRTEHEADLVGMMLMAWARIHPSEVHESLELLDWLMDDTKEVGWMDTMLSSHPTTAARKALADDFLPTALEVYYRTSNYGSCSRAAPKWKGGVCLNWHNIHFPTLFLTD